MTAPKWWDFTVPKDKWTIDELIQRLDENGADRYAIGDEVGSTGYAHFQGRVVFKVGKEISTVCNLLGFRRGLGPDMDRWGNVSPTHVRNFEYVKKEGKFYCSWEGALRKFTRIELLQWQSECEKLIHQQSERQVLCIVNESGNIGKTWLAKYLEATHQADVCPVSDGDASNYLEYCCKHPAKGYVFDVPKADSIKSKKAMWRAIEQVKNGLLYDRRYTSEKMWIEPPKIVIFTNEYPPVDTLSADRWQVYTVCKVLGECKGLQEMQPYWDEQAQDYQWAPCC